MPPVNKSNPNLLLAELRAARTAIDNAISLISNKKSPKKKQVKTPSVSKSLAALDYSLNLRTFVSRYAQRLSGAKKFTLLLAYETKGKIDQEKPAKTIIDKWARMTAKDLLGYEFNTKFSNEAKTKGWVNSKKTGVYFLTKEWTKSLL